MSGLGGQGYVRPYKTSDGKQPRATWFPPILMNNSLLKRQGPEKGLVIQNLLAGGIHCNNINKTLFLGASLNTWCGFY